jgi:hypothetical protein
LFLQTLAPLVKKALLGPRVFQAHQAWRVQGVNEERKDPSARKASLVSEVGSATKDRPEPRD